MDYQENIKNKKFTTKNININIIIIKLSLE